jgi:aryl sulfotransferase
MPAHLLGTIVRIAGALAALFLVQLVHLALVLAWADRQTAGLAYYGAAPDARRRFRRRLRLHARILAPCLWLQSRLTAFRFDRATFRAEGLAGPLGTCAPETFTRGRAYRPGPEDVFVATMMKCGTTWMLHVVYQVLRRGAGDLVETGSTLHAVCPWLEGRRTVKMEQAPLVGTARPSRIIKTHFPATHVPWSEAARYIYVARHPASCYASTADFIRENAGWFAPEEAAIEAWFTSEEAMWWGTWPAHVEGWWRKHAESANVLFVTFEEMKRDLPAVVRQVAAFLGVEPLGPAELAAVVEKCSFRYMQAHQEAFEMHPPQLLGVDAAFFVGGSAERHAGLPAPLRARLGAWCAGRLAGGRFPLARYYPDVTKAPPAP